MDEISPFSPHQQFSASGVCLKDEIDRFLDESVSALFDTKQDLLLDWDDSTTTFTDTFADDVDFKCDLDIKSELPDICSPILTNALTSPVPIKLEQDIKSYSNGGDKILFPGDVEPLQISSGIQTDNVLKRITQARSVLINGEKEIFGKNIIGLHSLNEIKTSPDENCQITSTVINGKKYKVIIRPKSSSKTPTKVQINHGAPTVTVKEFSLNEDLISELQDGNYNVLEKEYSMDPWLQLSSQDTLEMELDILDPVPTPALEPPRVPPLRIKIPKAVKKVKTKKEKELPKPKVQPLPVPKISKTEPKLAQKSVLRKAAVAKPPPSERPRGRGRPPNPDRVKPTVVEATRVKKEEEAEETSTSTSLVEKNPRKDSGLDSNDVSDASEDITTNNDSSDSASVQMSISPVPSPVPAPVITAPILAQQLTSKLREERRRLKNHSSVTKMAAALFRAANAVTSGQKVALPTQVTLPQTCDSTTNSEPPVQEPVLESAPEPQPPVVERPRKKLKLEEYLSRRHDKDEVTNNSSNSALKAAAIVPKIEVATPNQDPNGLMTPGQIKVEYNESAEPGTFDLIMTNDGSVTVMKSEVEVEVKNEIVDVEVESPPQKQPELKRHRKLSPKIRDRRLSSSSSNSSNPQIRRKLVSKNHSNRSGSLRRNCLSPSRGSTSPSTSTSSGEHPSRRTSSNSKRYRRRSRSRNRSPYRSRSRNSSRSRGFGERHRAAAFYRQGRRSRSPPYSHREKQRVEVEERRVVYVGRIAEGTTNQQLRQRFSKFGPILDISVHFRERADNYGFVTFTNKDDAYEAVEHGNDNPNMPRYDLCFGGRRTFCRQRYSDLDGMPNSYSDFKDEPVPRNEDDSFDDLLDMAIAKLHTRKEVT